jgi:hypothetical protein
MEQVSGFSEADLIYIHANYFTLDELCAGRGDSPSSVGELIDQRQLPAPSYVLDDGTEMFPADYFVFRDQVGGDDLRRAFEARYRSAGGRQSELEVDWNFYLDGTYGICLRHVLPETIVRKGELVASLERLLSDPDPRSREWRGLLRREVWELDALEREFAPDYDRKRSLGRPLTRDRLIAGARDLYPDALAAEVGDR